MLRMKHKVLRLLSDSLVFLSSPTVTYIKQTIQEGVIIYKEEHEIKLDVSPRVDMLKKIMSSVSLLIYIFTRTSFFKMNMYLEFIQQLNLVKSISC